MRVLMMIVLCAAMVFAGNTLLFTPKELAEIKVLPKDGSDAVQMIKKGILLQIKSTLTDTLGREWYMVMIQGSNTGGFVLGSDIEPAGDGESGESFVRLTKEETQDKKRRMNEIKRHDDWPRRIKSAVRDGAVCLKMTTEQVTASWQQPYQKTKGFILGFGDVSIFFFRADNPIAVIIKNNEVIGWSEKE